VVVARDLTHLCYTFFALITPRGGCCAPLVVLGRMSKYDVRSMEQALLARRFKKRSSAVWGGGRSSHLMAWPHVYISRLDTRLCGELRDCGVRNSGGGSRIRIVDRNPAQVNKQIFLAVDIRIMRSYDFEKKKKKKKRTTCRNSNKWRRKRTACRLR
jgi:hypothetical protein